jgi:hypothetical protein
MAKRSTAPEVNLSDIRTQVAANTAQLEQLTSVVRLLAFACDARRVLTELEDLCNIDPALSDRLAKNIAARRSWIEHEDATAEVLLRVGNEMQEVCEAGDRIVVSLSATDAHEGQSHRTHGAGQEGQS